MNILKPHLSLNVTNIDKSVDFYERAFGVPASKRRPGYAKFDLEAPLLNLTMQEGPRSGVNANHFGIQVASTRDVVEAQIRFEEAGLLTRPEEDTQCCYALQDKVWIEDPDGNAWEVFVVKDDAPVMKATPSSTSGACCSPAPAGPAETSAPSACCPPKSHA